MTSHEPVLAALYERQSRVVRGFLWSLFAIVAATLVLNVVLLGPANVGPAAVVPNLTFLAVIGASLGLAHRRRTGPALAVVVVLILLSVAGVVSLVGTDAAGRALAVLFIPVVLVGLLRGRTALYVTGAACVVVALGPPVLRSLGALPPRITGEIPWVTAGQYAIVLITVVFFLDRFGGALNDALRTAVDREAALAREVAVHRETESQLREARSFHDVIIETVPGMFYLVSEDGTYVQWNRRFARDMGYADDEIDGMRPADLFPDMTPDLQAAFRARTLRDGPRTIEAPMTTKDGRRLPHLVTATPVRLGEGQFVAGVAIDVSELAAAKDEISRLNHDLVGQIDHVTALREIDQAIIGSHDLTRTLAVILDRVMRQLGMDAGRVLAYSPHDGRLRCVSQRGFVAPAPPSLAVRLGEGAAGRVAMARTTTVLRDAAELRRGFERVHPIDAEGFTAYVGAPLIARTQLQGVLELFSRGPFEPSPAWLASAEGLATQVAIALHSASVLDDLARSNHELRLAYDTTIEGWARALDLRDHETEGHSRRVTDMTVWLAEALEVEEDVVQIRRGALLHDIGKMGVPDAVLLKPDALTPDEWAIMRQHPVLAFELLSPIAFLGPAIDIPYAHHERWDGTGYPRGLAGEQIPTCARIFAVADVFDALTSDRPYRPAWSRERALDHIRSEAGSHFDPEVAATFVAMMDGDRGDRAPDP
jgi:PAS domain S-box-containing protein/putative nucleotidyltransferase with HDIG domain